MSSRSIPAMPTAVRAPGTLRSRSLPWFWMVRTLPTRPEGRTRTVSPRARLPDHVVPVTTVPTPATESARSIGRRNKSSSGRDGRRSASCLIPSRNSGMPSPRVAETSIGDEKGTGPSESHSLTSSATISAHSRSTVSTLVITGMPAGIPSCCTTARCSLVWGMMPSSAATTSRTRSIPAAPATMVRTRSSWPGTSTTPAVTPSPRSSEVK